MKDVIYVALENDDFFQEMIAAALDRAGGKIHRSGLSVTAEALVYVDDKPVVVIQTNTPDGDEQIDAICAFYESLIWFSPGGVELHNFDQHGAGCKIRYAEAAVRLARKYFGVLGEKIKTSREFDKLENMYVPTPWC